MNARTLEFIQRCVEHLDPDGANVALRQLYFDAEKLLEESAIPDDALDDTDKRRFVIIVSDGFSSLVSEPLTVVPADAAAIRQTTRTRIANSNGGRTDTFEIRAVELFPLDVIAEQPWGSA